MKPKALWVVGWRTAVVLAGGLALTWWIRSPSHVGPSLPRNVNFVPKLALSGPGATGGAAKGVPSTCASSSGSVESAVSNLSGVQQEVALLRKEVAALQRQLHLLQNTVPSGTAESSDMPLVQGLDPLARAAAERGRQEQMAIVEADFQREPLDRAWALQTAGTVQEVLTSDPLGQSAIQHVECRSHTCRVELATAESGELNKALPLLLQQLAPTLPSVTANSLTDSAGERMILYLSGDAAASTP